MEYNGLLQKFPINRSLTEGERRLQLKQKLRIDTEPLYQLSVIRMNSTYLEMTDKYYGWKGSLVTIALPIFVALAGFFAALLYSSIFGGGDVRPAPIWFDVAIAAIPLPLLALLIWLFFKDAYTYTHYPIRMNRKTRMVHVFRLNGTVLTVPWDQLFFCLSKCTSAGQWDIRGHVLDKDGVTVRETFSLTDWDFGPAEAVQNNLRRYWEFVRRYMEDGAGAVSDRVHFCMPIETKRESLKVGFERMFAVATGQPLPLVLFVWVFAALFLPGRWFAMRTSKIPVWPKEIEDVCRIDLNDPYVKDGSMNPLDLR